MKSWKAALHLFAILFLGSTTHSFAHHGTSVNYEMSEIVALEGTVTRFVWRNPHSALLLNVTTHSGETASHAIELPSPASMSQTHGWTRHTFKPGDVVVIKVHPSKTGAAVWKSVSCERGGCDPVINGAPVK